LRLSLLITYERKKTVVPIRKNVKTKFLFRNVE